MGGKRSLALAAPSHTRREIAKWAGQLVATNLG
jgi:hypothetical protein